MGSLNGTDKISQFLESEVIDLGEGLGKDEQVAFETKWLGQNSDIFFVFGGCHCTDAWVEGETIKGTINIARSQYDRETGQLTQYVMVYMNDGQDFYVIDPHKRRKSNPEKEWIRIQLTGKVDI